MAGRRRKLNVEEELEAVKRHREGERTRAIAADFGVSVRTLERTYQRLGYEVVPGPRVTGIGLGDYHHSCLGRWVRANPGVPLPRSVRAISDLTGCSRNAVKTYLYRRRKEIRARAKRLHPAMFGSTLLDTRGRRIPAAALGKVRVGVAPWSFDIYFACDLKGGGKATFKLSYESFKRHLQATQEKPEPP